MIKSLALAAAASFLFFTVHFFLFHIKRIARCTLTMISIFLVVLVFYVWAYWSPAGDIIRGWIPLAEPAAGNHSFGWRLFYCFNGFVYYFSVFFVYLEIYYTADRSITIRIMRDIQNHPEKSITIDEFKKKYETDQQVFYRRFDEMVTNGYLKKEGTVYRLTPLGVFVAKYNDFLIRFINLKGG